MKTPAPNRLTHVRTFKIERTKTKQARTTGEYLCDPVKGGCGKTVKARPDQVRMGRIKSCGCLKRDWTKENRMKARPELPNLPPKAKTKAPEGPTSAEKFNAWIEAGRPLCCPDAVECLAEGKCRRRMKWTA